MWINDYLSCKSQNLPLNYLCYCKNGEYSRWEDIRFRIERQYKMVIVNLFAFQEACINRKRYPIQGDTCIVGIRESECKKGNKERYALGDDFNVNQTDEIILLLRLPSGKSKLNSKRTNTYIPNVFCEKLYRAQVNAMKENLMKEFHLCNNDEDKLDIMQKLAYIDYRPCEEPLKIHEGHKPFQRCTIHPSRFVIKEQFKGFLDENGNEVSWSSIPKSIPEDGYVCYHCCNYFSPPHFSDDCPSNDDPLWVSMNERASPTGIPKTELRQVALTDPIDVVRMVDYVDKNNNLWIHVK